MLKIIIVISVCFECMFLCVELSDLSLKSTQPLRKHFNSRPMRVGISLTKPLTDGTIYTVIGK